MSVLDRISASEILALWETGLITAAEARRLLGLDR